MNYYLVIPGSYISEGKTGSYWMIDNGDTWINAANSRWKEKHELDRVLEVVKEEHLTLPLTGRRPSSTGMIISQAGSPGMAGSMAVRPIITMCSPVACSG